MTIIASYVPDPIDLTPFIADARRMISGGAELEEVWGYLRKNGVWLSDSITITVELTSVARRDAKWMVCHSQTWSDMFPAIVRLHDSIEQALNELTEEEPGTITYRSGTPAEAAR